jgi:hypothetical protein
MVTRGKVFTYFVEDEAQEVFIKALIQRLSTDAGISIQHNPGSVVTGGSRSLVALKTFLREEQHRRVLATDVLVLSVDGNCQGYQRKIADMNDIIQRAQYLKPFVCAVPDPHIERWYLCDHKALRQALSSSITPKPTPKNKCGRDWYKTEYHRLLKEAKIPIILNDYEHAEAIVEKMNLYEAGRNEPSLGQFLNDLRSALKNLAQNR